MTEFFFCLFTQGFVIDVAEIAKFSFAQVFSLRQSVGALGELLINYMDSGISFGRF